MSPDPGGNRSWRVRRYRPGDEQALLALFNAEFGLQRTLEHWQWQFRDNPYGGPYIVVAEREADGMLVGSHVAMPFPLNVLGRERVGGHSLDLVVHHDFRRQGIFETTASACFEWLREAGVAAVVAFPNANSYPGFVRTLGWHRIVVPQRWTRRIGTRHMPGGPPARAVGWLLDLPLRMASRFDLARRTAAARADGTRFAVHPSVPASVDALWDGRRSQEVLSLWKDRRYLAWRYEANPDHRFEFSCLEGGDGLTAFAVTTILGSRQMLCELMVRDRSSSTAARLVSHIVARAIDDGLDSVGFLGSDYGLYDEAFAGFRSHRAHENVFCGRSLVTDDDLPVRLPVPENWTLVFGDGDFV